MVNCVHCKVFDNMTVELEQIGEQSMLRDNTCACCAIVLRTVELHCKRCDSIYKMVYKKNGTVKK